MASLEERHGELLGDAVRLVARVVANELRKVRVVGDRLVVPDALADPLVFT